MKFYRMARNGGECIGTAVSDRDYRFAVLVKIGSPGSPWVVYSWHTCWSGAVKSWVHLLSIGRPGHPGTVPPAVTKEEETMNYLKVCVAGKAVGVRQTTGAFQFAVVVGTPSGWKVHRWSRMADSADRRRIEVLRAGVRSVRVVPAYQVDRAEYLVLTASLAGVRG